MASFFVGCVLAGCGVSGKKTREISGDGLSLQASLRQDDIHFRLVSAQGADSLEFTLSGLCPVSTRKPWALAPQRFSGVRLEQRGAKDQGLRVDTGQSPLSVNSRLSAPCAEIRRKWVRSCRRLACKLNPSPEISRVFLPLTPQPAKNTAHKK